MARKINQAPSTQITQLATDDILYVARPSGLSDHWIKAQKFSAINPNEGDLQYFTGGNWVKTNGLLSWDGSQFTVNGVPVTVQDELVGGQAASAILQTPTVGEDGYVVSWDNTAGEFTLTPILESISLDQLSDVDVDGAADNDMLYRFGGQWVDTGGLLTWNGSIFQVTGTINATVLTTTGQIRAGSATNPNISFVDDPDTGFTAAGNTISVYNNGVTRWVFSGGAHFRSTQNKVSNLGLSTNIWNNFYSVTNWQSEQAPPASGDITGLGRTYVSDVDGLYYFRDELGNVYNLTAGGAPDGAEHELQENDGAGGFRGTKVFSNADGDLTLGDSGLAGAARTFTASGSETNVGVTIQLKGDGNGLFNVLGGSATVARIGSASGSGSTTFQVFGNAASGILDSLVSIEAKGTRGSKVSILAQAGGGDPLLEFGIPGTRTYGFGVDNSDSDILKLVTGSSLADVSSGTELMSMLPDGLITWNQTLNDATGDEVAFTITPTINKLTSGNYTGLLLDVTETSAPGTDNRLIDLKVGGSGVFAAYPTGSLTLGKDTLDLANVNYIGIEYPRGVGHIAKVALTGNPESYYFNNLYHNGTNWVHKETNTSAIYALGWNGHFFYANASQTAGTAAAFLLGLSIANASSVVEVSVAPSAGAKLGFFGAAASVVSTGWAVSNVTLDKVYDANATDTDELADVLGTLINELITKGLISA
jgi:hypothetical protein